MDLSDYDAKQELSRASTLPARWYLDNELFELEKERLFKDTWQAVGRLDQLAAPGSSFEADIAGEPVVVLRDDQGQLRALSRVCRHRAGQVKVARRCLTCQYHGWTYDFTGQLTGAAEFQGVEGWRKENVRLPTFAVDSWGPLVFVKVLPDGPDLKQFLGEIVGEVAGAGYNLSAYRMVHRVDYLVKCNWKVYVDNYLEGYHIPAAHPGLFQELDYAQYRVDTRRFHSFQYAPMRAAARAASARRYGSTERDQQQALYYWLFPNLMINIYPDNMSTNLIVPLSAKETLTVFEWFLPPGADLPPDEVTRLVSFSDGVQHEDIAICESVQRGLNSRFYDQGRFSVKRENGVHHFHQLVAEFLQTKGGDGL